MSMSARLPRGFFALAGLVVVSAGSAQAQFRTYIGYAPQRYVIVQRQPAYYHRVYAGDSYPGDYQLYDVVNRPNPLTPEPVWREMFPGIRRRIVAERREFGVDGQSGRELRYWRRYEQRVLPEAADK